jgi:hypothetical protein
MEMINDLLQTGNHLNAVQYLTLANNKQFLPEEIEAITPLLHMLDKLDTRVTKLTTEGKLEVAKIGINLSKTIHHEMISLLNNNTPHDTFCKNCELAIAIAHYKIEGWNSFFADVLATLKVFFDAFSKIQPDLTPEKSLITNKPVMQYKNFKHQYQATVNNVDEEPVNTRPPNPGT